MDAEDSARVRTQASNRTLLAWGPEDHGPEQGVQPVDPGVRDDLAGEDAREDRGEQKRCQDEPGERRRRPPREETAGARSRAGAGTALSQLVSEDR